MDHEDRIGELEDRLQAEEAKINDLFRVGKVPAAADYADADRIRKELKVARRVRAMDAKRVDPKFTRQIGVRLTEDEYQELTKRAAESGVELSTHIRNLLKI
jgi:hypothetical protein